MYCRDWLARVFKDKPNYRELGSASLGSGFDFQDRP